MTERRTYKTTVPRRGIRTTPIYEFRTDGEADRMVLELHEESRPDAIDVAEALQKAYGGGREDRSEEILGEAGLARAAAEAALHRPHGVLGDTVLGEVVGCRCRKFEGRSIEEWQQHLAYEILQAAARLP